MLYLLEEVRPGDWRAAHRGHRVSKQMLPKQKALMSIDFKHTFPYLFWISNWATDESYPEGFRYKILVIRNVKTKKLDVSLVLEESNGDKTLMRRFSADVGDLALTALREFVKKLEDSFNIEFEEQDFSDVETYEEFEVRTARLGWHGYEIKK